ncbi:Lactoylglutathione lyase [Candidatus Rhodobacter oscarellae]|uniref:Lactoylglutathione lyase n=1 Tax=Candidatus Rhodobacter oscarellae TaxID=1675527 RepID=A0A0J9E8V5_9RHOB|nr:VOC family protein [Candidatus Rhodobacter lobularis]KMW59081.1 Lactoylglutathione lyase [Candidatus Rhodobacter lobularis]
MTRPEGPNTLAITFFYYKDLPRAMAFYEDVLGLPLAIDQGWSKIYRVAEGAHIGLVDENHGMNSWTSEKPVQFCIRVPDVDAWYAYVEALGLPGQSELFVNDEIGIRAFVFDDPEGYQVEIQTSTRDDILL